MKNINIRGIVNLKGLDFFLTSLRASVIEYLKFENALHKVKLRKNGISVLLPTQNEELMVELSILSFLDFADEIIVVDNGSIDNTKEIVKELVKKYPKIKFFDKPELLDLYQNRSFALKQSQYRWICRFDSDFVAYTDGSNNIIKLRKYLLNLPKGIIPKVILLKYVNTGGDFWHFMIHDFVLKKERTRVIDGPRMSIYEYFPLSTFFRFKRREFYAFQIFMKKIIVKPVYIMHCTIKSKLSYFLRSERSNWRGTSNFKKYPTLLSYIKGIIKEKYNTTNFKEALNHFMKEEILKEDNFIEYNSELYLPYPSLIKDEMKKKDVYRIDKYFDK